MNRAVSGDGTGSSNSPATSPTGPTSPASIELKPVTSLGGLDVPLPSRPNRGIGAVGGVFRERRARRGRTSSTSTSSASARSCPAALPPACASCSGGAQYVDVGSVASPVVVPSARYSASAKAGIAALLTLIAQLDPLHVRDGIRSTPCCPARNTLIRGADHADQRAGNYKPTTLARLHGTRRSRSRWRTFAVRAHRHRHPAQGSAAVSPPRTGMSALQISLSSPPAGAHGRRTRREAAIDCIVVAARDVDQGNSPPGSRMSGYASTTTTCSPLPINPWSPTATTHLKRGARGRQARPVRSRSPASARDRNCGDRPVGLPDSHGGLPLRLRREYDAC